jgi:hypothetical protein
MLEVGMANMQLKIDQKSKDVFEFSFYRNAPARELHEERADIVRLMDEATDALMRASQKIESMQLNGTSQVYRITIQAGGLDEKS